MLVGISPLLSPELLAALYRMGHGDEVVLADAHFPGHSYNDNTLRADGLKVAELLDAILPLFPLDDYVDSPVFMMSPVSGDQADPGVEAPFRAAVDRHWPDTAPIAMVERFAFYEQTRRSCCVVMTGETAKYGNIILKKGVAPVA